MPLDLEIQLIVEKLSHALDLQKAQVDALHSTLDHDREISRLRLEAIDGKLKDLKDKDTDFETRLRDVFTGVIQSRFFIGLVGASILLALAALVKAFFF